MKKITLIISVLVFMFVSVNSVYAKKKNLTQHFNNNGLGCTKVTHKAPEMIGAIFGCGLVFNNENDEVEIYKFDLKSPGIIYKEAKSNGSFKYFTGTPLECLIPAKVNRAFLLIIPENHPSKDKIVKVFMSF